MANARCRRRVCHLSSAPHTFHTRSRRVVDEVAAGHTKSGGPVGHHTHTHSQSHAFSHSMLNSGNPAMLLRALQICTDKINSKEYIKTKNEVVHICLQNIHIVGYNIENG